MGILAVIQNALYFLALINPASKLCILSSMQATVPRRTLAALAIRSTAAAFLILLALTVGGNFLLRDVFKVQLYSLKVAGGAILFLVGLTAVRRGRFFEDPLQPNATDISIVPLAAPLIAGPGTITGALSFASEAGVLRALGCITLALALNLGVMLLAPWVGRFLERVNAVGPLIRITGLIVAAVAVQMVFDGAGAWLAMAAGHFAR